MHVWDELSSWQVLFPFWLDCPALSILDVFWEWRLQLILEVPVLLPVCQWPFQISTICSNWQTTPVPTSITWVKSYINGFPLCPTCHANFDTMVEPGFILIPTDINYFSKFEGNNCNRRQRAWEIHGKTPRREFPTAAQYKDHQTAQLRGLYTQMRLEAFTNLSSWSPFCILWYCAILCRPQALAWCTICQSMTGNACLGWRQA